MDRHVVLVEDKKMQISTEGQLLIVDDSGNMRAYLKQKLQELGFTDFIEASTGRLALDLLKQIPKGDTLRLIFCDVNMPEMDGVRFLEQLRLDARWNEVPFIVVTQNSDIKTVMKFVQMGADAYLIKPIKLEDLETKIYDAIVKRKTALKSKKS